MMQRFFDCLLNAVRTRAGANRKQSASALLHDIFDMREIYINKSGLCDQLRNALYTLTEYIVGQGKRHL